MKSLIVTLMIAYSTRALSSDDHHDNDHHDDPSISAIPESSSYAAGVFVLAAGTCVFIRNRKNK